MYRRDNKHLSVFDMVDWMELLQRAVWWSSKCGNNWPLNITITIYSYHKSVWKSDFHSISWWWRWWFYLPQSGRVPGKQGLSCWALSCHAWFLFLQPPCHGHYSDVIMDTMASQITSLTIVYSSVDSGADQRKHQSSASLAFVRGIHRWPVNSPHKGPVTRKNVSIWWRYHGSWGFFFVRIQLIFLFAVSATLKFQL